MYAYIMHMQVGIIKSMSLLYVLLFPAFPRVDLVDLPEHSVDIPIDRDTPDNCTPSSNSVIRSECKVEVQYACFR
jgi:hypothetical protein